MTPFEFRTVPRIVSEAGCSVKLGELMAPTLQQSGLQGGVKLFVLVDPFIAKASAFQQVVGCLVEAGHLVQVCSDIEPDPPEALIHRVVKEARQFEAQAVVAIGGGSTLDVAKLIAILIKGEQDLPTMYGVGNVKSRRVPLVLLPTTAGTGSEVTPISIVTTGVDTKMGVVSPVLYADLAVLDADWTLTLPQHVTAATGIDAMVHAIEAYTSVRLKNRYSDFLACEALKLLASHLMIACEQPSNREARQAMMLGACMAGQAFANAPVGAVHALAYPIGGIFHVPHGLSNALVLEQVMRFNLPKAQQWYAEIARTLSLASATDNDTQSANSLIEWASQLSPKSGLPSKLRDVGIAQSDLPKMATAAMLQTRLLSNNPRAMDEAQALAIYTAAW